MSQHIFDRLKTKNIASKVFKVVKIAAQVAVISHCTFEHLFDFVICSGPSMEPAIHSKDVLVTNKLSIQLGHSINRGDIVISKNPMKPEQLICKRVIGTPGDVILAQESMAKALNLPEEVKSDIQYKTVTVPRGHVWIEGDNSFNSNDSRNYGPIPKGLVVSRVAFRLLPIQSFGFI